MDARGPLVCSFPESSSTLWWDLLVMPLCLRHSRAYKYLSHAPVKPHGTHQHMKWCVCSVHRSLSAVGRHFFYLPENSHTFPFTTVKSNGPLLISRPRFPWYLFSAGRFSRYWRHDAGFSLHFPDDLEHKTGFPSVCCLLHFSF